MKTWEVICSFVVCLAATSAYNSHRQASFLPDALLQEVAERIGMTEDDPASYLDFPDSRLEQALALASVLPERSQKDLHLRSGNPEKSLLGDYDVTVDEPNNPMIRDQEYLQHSSLWGHQYMAGGAGEGKQRLRPDGDVKNQKEVKTDAILPAYCNPPNPCPVGYSVDDGCLEDFENTAAFSRDFQSAQDCMCDTEHMFDCPDIDREGGPEAEERAMGQLARSLQMGAQGFANSAIGDFAHRIQVEGAHKSLVAKKFNTSPMRFKKTHIFGSHGHGIVAPKIPTHHVKPNPYLQGEKLPVAAKKGNHVH